MDIVLQPGLYVVAVSGGVDSVVLLDLLRQDPNLRLVVAHFDHGIREDATEDRRFVQELAVRYDLPFVYSEGNLGEQASEATARKARYDFLHSVRNKSGAQAIVTAHHQDDLLETALLNLMRGTGRKGITALKSTDTVRRPLLHVPKNQLLEYAKANNLRWREDSTNANVRYKRNYIRHKVVPKLTAKDRAKLLQNITILQRLNETIDRELQVHLPQNPEHRILLRRQFIMLPHTVALELLAAWLRQNDVRDFDRRALQRITVAAKTLQAGQRIDVNGQFYVMVSKDQLILSER